MKKNYPELMTIRCCPECYSDEYTKIKEPTGFFEFDKYHFVCQKCNATFESEGILFAIPRNPIKEIIQLFIDKKIDKNEFKNRLNKFSIYIFR